MAVNVRTSQPASLRAKIDAAIDDGEIKTWVRDSDGDYSHSPAQWLNKAWFVASVKPSMLVFSIISPLNVTMSRTTYAVYHGRFIEMLLAHFDLEFTSVEATALPTSADRVNGA